MAVRSDSEFCGSNQEADWDAVTAIEISPADIDALSPAIRNRSDDASDRMKAAKIEECRQRLFFGEAPRDSLECLLLINSTELTPLDIPVRVVEGPDFGFVTSSSVGSRSYVIPPSATAVELPSEKDADEGLVERDPYTDPTRSCLSVLSTDGSFYQAKPSETRVEIGESRSSSVISEGSFYEKPPSEALVEMDSRLSEMNGALSDASFYKPFPSEIVVEMGINNSKLAQLKELIEGSRNEGSITSYSEISDLSFYEPFPSEIAVEMGLANSKLAQLKKLFEESGDENCSTAGEFSVYSKPPSEALVEFAN